jgi:hypothetical protein
VGEALSNWRLYPTGRWGLGSFCDQDEAQNVEHGRAICLCGADERAKGGIGFGAPLTAEPIGHLSEDDAGAEMPLGDVVGIGQIPCRSQNIRLIRGISGTFDDRTDKNARDIY